MTKELKALSEAEKEIMQIIWQNSGSIEIPFLLKELSKKGKQWREATVRSFINRLVIKGFLYSKKQTKNAIYIAIFTEEQYISQQTKTFFNKSFGGNIQTLLASLVNHRNLNTEELEDVKKRWNELKDGRK